MVQGRGLRARRRRPGALSGAARVSRVGPAGRLRSGSTTYRRPRVEFVGCRWRGFGGWASPRRELWRAGGWSTSARRGGRSQSVRCRPAGCRSVPRGPRQPRVSRRHHPGRARRRAERTFLECRSRLCLPAKGWAAEQIRIGHLVAGLVQLSERCSCLRNGSPRSVVAEADGGRERMWHERVVVVVLVELGVMPRDALQRADRALPEPFDVHECNFSGEDAHFGGEIATRVSIWARRRGRPPTSCRCPPRRRLPARTPCCSPATGAARARSTARCWRGR